MFKYIIVNDNGVILLDKYFKDLKVFSKAFPESLREFSSDLNRYLIDGKRTLHDAYLVDLSISKNYDDECQSVATSVVIKLKLNNIDEILFLNYFDVVRIDFSLNPTFWPSRPVDLLVHEFFVDSEGCFGHKIMFDRGVWIEVVFKDFSYC